MNAVKSSVVVRLDMKTSQGKKKELLKTLEELDPIIRREKGCRQFTISEPIQHEDTITVLEKWASSEDALRYFGSESFEVLSGAAFVLAKTLKMAINIELTTASIDLKSMESREKIYFWAEKTLSEAQNLKKTDLRKETHK